ncbi:P-loop containing nucleoside triphosphate hydrolase protein [Mycena epipterygia]|nr:P-loop containing nucleoside triphosphate hydrolase protein [Mycena epipterygia]
MSFFDTILRCSMGCIISILRKDIDTIDKSLPVIHAHVYPRGDQRFPTIRSYGEIPRSIRDNKYYIELENRLPFLTVTNQRWLAMRLDALGCAFVFLLFAVTTRLSAEVENYMNSVERVVHYARGTVPKKPLPRATRSPSRPRNARTAQRPARDIEAGDKVGVVGRTGAGKSSLALCLLRIVEYLGEIVVDDVDIGKIGLTDLRSNIAIIPQEMNSHSPTLFSSTVRTAFDLFSEYDEVRLWYALRNSYLVETPPSTPIESVPPETENGHKVSLDTVIKADGANLSVGERSLLSLARALVNDSRVVILDEAIASVDLDTQQTMHTQFKDRMLICIAHRLRTIIAYDRILVLDAGKISEFDTPLNLFNRNDGLFRSLCEKSNIMAADIEKGISYDDDLD